MPKHLLFSLCLAAVGAVNAQDTGAGNSFIKAATDYVDTLYYHVTDKQSRLYNGIEHIGYSPSIKGYAYFFQNKRIEGTIVYDGMPYKELLMQYDVFNDEVVIMHYNNYMRMNLLSEKVKEFALGGHHFVRIRHDSLAPAKTTPSVTGFYDMLYEGKVVTALCKRGKLLDRKVTDVVEEEFLDHDNYYILKDGLYHSVSNYRQLLAVLKDRSRDIRSYLRKNKIKFRKARETAIVKAAMYYDSIKK